MVFKDTKIIQINFISWFDTSFALKNGTGQKIQWVINHFFLNFR